MCTIGLLPQCSAARVALQASVVNDYLKQPIVAQFKGLFNCTTASYRLTAAIVLVGSSTLASAGARYATCSVQHSQCKETIRNLHYERCNMQRATCNARRTT
jgi:hypothetical protein